jgi:phosphatidate phosphatase APP1
MCVSIPSSVLGSAYSTHENITSMFEKTQSIVQPEGYIWVNSNPIYRGDIQTITFGVFDSCSGQGIPGVPVDGTITYAPGLPVNIRSFTGVTDDSGYFNYSWIVDPVTQPGLFTVTISAVSEQHSFRMVKSIMFEVIA